MPSPHQDTKASSSTNTTTTATTNKEAISFSNPASISQPPNERLAGGGGKFGGDSVAQPTRGKPGQQLDRSNKNPSQQNTSNYQQAGNGKQQNAPQNAVGAGGSGGGCNGAGGKPPLSGNGGPGNKSVQNATRTRANVGDSATSGSSAKIDGDLVNVANENRVILNVGGIRHETYKVS